jgi:putative phosphoesterase
MKFAIVSDTHDNIKSFNKIIDWLNAQKIDLILHCGDICRQETIDEATKNFKGEIKWVKGNGDYQLDIPETMEAEVDGKKIFFNHYPDVARRAAETGKYDFSFYGHTHKPWEEKVGKCRVVNPGEAAGQTYQRTFAVYDTATDKLELKLVDQL